MAIPRGQVECRAAILYSNIYLFSMHVVYKYHPMYEGEREQPGMEGGSEWCRGSEEGREAERRKGRRQREEYGRLIDK